MDLKKIIKDSGLRLDHVAAKLFPDNAHPYDALNRVMSRGGSLKADQVKALADVLGVSADELLGTNWKGKALMDGIVLYDGSTTVTVFANTFEVWHHGARKAYPLKPGISVKAFLEEIEEIKNDLSNAG